ncbi:MAG: hypothetical protein NVSMB1_22270 [Polyangiales bacterium]
MAGLLAAFFQTADGVNSTYRGALRGAKDVRAVALIGTTVAWSCIPTSAYFLGRLAGWGSFGGWCGIGLEKILAGFFLYRRWRRRHWCARSTIRLYSQRFLHRQ